MPRIGVKLYNNMITLLGDTEKDSLIKAVITTIVDNQEIAEIELFLMEETGNHFIGRIIVKNIPPAVAGDPRIVFSLTVDQGHNLDIKVDVDGAASQKLKIPHQNWYDEYIKEPSKRAVFTHEKKPEEKDELHLRFTTKAAPEGKVSHAIIPSKKDGEKKKKSFVPLLVGIGGAVLATAIILMFTVGPCTPSGKESSQPAKLPVATSRITPEPPAATRGSFTPQPAITPVVSPVAASSPEFTHVITMPPTASPRITAAPTSSPLPQPTSLRTEMAGTLNLKEINSKIEAILPVYFQPNSDMILFQYGGTIESLADYLRGFKGKIKITITGHAALSGTEVGQHEVSLSRAEWVREQLVAAGAVNQEDCLVKGAGTSQLVYRGPDTTLYYMNRRVTITVERK